MTDAGGRPPAMSRRVALAAALLVLVHALLVVLDARATGLTKDEASYFNSARIVLNHGWVHRATLFQGPVGLLGTQLFAGEVPSGGLSDPEAQRELVVRGRLGTLPFGLLAAALVFAWSRRLFGDSGALLSLLLYALHPVVLGYSSLMLVDVQHSALVLLSLFVLWRWLATRSPRLLWLLGVALGLALATKYLAGIVAAVAGVTVAAAAALRSGPGAARRVGAAAWALARVVACAWLTLHAAYLFRGGFAGRDAESRNTQFVRALVETPVLGHAVALLPAPFLAGVDYQGAQSLEQHKPFLNGEFAERQPATYLYAILYKTPEVALLCALLALVLRAPLLRRGAPHGWRAAALAIVPYALVSLAFLSASRMQLGIRYALPLLPLIALGSGALLWSPERRAPGARAFVLLALLAAVHARELAGAWPDWISYYNRVAGGQLHAFRRFRDTNSDFGQHRRDGPARLRAEHPAVVLVGPRSGARFGRVAIDCDGLFYEPGSPGGHAVPWLVALEPLASLGASWWVFDVTPEALETAVEEAEEGERARMRRDLALAYLGAERRADAERHLSLLEPELAAPLREAAALEDAARASPTRESLEAALRAWTELGRPDRALELAEPHGALLDGSDAVALARVHRLEEEREWAAAARELDREWSDPDFPKNSLRVVDLRKAGDLEGAHEVILEMRRDRAHKPLTRPFQNFAREVEERLEFVRLLR